MGREALRLPAKELLDEAVRRYRAWKPDADKISTSHVERQNLTMRMGSRDRSEIVRLTAGIARVGRKSCFKAYNPLDLKRLRPAEALPGAVMQ